MMSDIYNENEDMDSATKIAQKLRDMYNLEIKPHDKTINYNPDIMRRRSALALKWPNDDLVAQIIKDAIFIMKQHNVNPFDIKY